MLEIHLDHPYGTSGGLCKMLLMDVAKIADDKTTATGRGDQLSLL
jgi:hypothetical protein